MDDPDKVTGRRLAAILGISGPSLSELKAKKIIPTKGTAYNLPEAIQAYIAHIKNKGGLSQELLAERVEKTKAERRKLEMQNQILAGEMVERIEVKAEAIRAGETFKAALRRLENDLPPMVEGLDAAQIQKRVQKAADAILLDMSDITGDLWADAQQPKATKKASGGRRPKRRAGK